MTDAAEPSPAYRKVSHDDGLPTTQYMIVCDEGWRQSIVCERMYGWAADWLLGILGTQPYAPGTRPAPLMPPAP